MLPEALNLLLAGPALEPPPGVTPDFDNPPNQNSLAMILTTFCMIVATLCLFLRIYARVLLEEKKIYVQDVLIICAYGAYWCTAYVSYSLIWTPGYYVHTWNLRNKDLIQPLYLILIYGCAYSAVLPLIKTAILLDWCKIFVPANRLKSSFWWACVTISIFQCTWGILCIILLNMQCVPHRAIWEFYIPSKCYSLPKVMLTSASVQVITDITMVLLPQKAIWSLHMSWERKLGVSIIFGVGVIASVAACFRLAHTVTFSKTTDSMYSIGPLLFWACGEMTCGFFILGVPYLPKILKESGFVRTLKESFSLRYKSTDPSKYVPDHSQRSRPRSSFSKSGITPETYYKISDDSIAMPNLGRLESQEQIIP